MSSTENSSDVIAEKVKDVTVEKEKGSGDKKDDVSPLKRPASEINNGEEIKKIKVQKVDNKEKENGKPEDKDDDEAEGEDDEDEEDDDEVPPEGEDLDEDEADDVDGEDEEEEEEDEEDEA